MSVRPAIERHATGCDCHACSLPRELTADENGYALDESGRLDPTQTTTLQRRYARWLRGRIEELDADIRDLIYEQDAFGLGDGPGGRWADRDAASQARAFDEWLRDTLDEDVLDPHDSRQVREWFEQAAKRGIRDAQSDLRDAAERSLAAGDIDREEYEALLADQPDIDDRVDETAVQDAVNLRMEDARQHVESNLEDFAGEARQLVTAGLAAGVGRSVLARDIVERGQVAKSNVTASAAGEIVNTFNSRKIGEWDRVEADLEIETEVEHVDAGDEKVCDFCLERSAESWTFEDAKAEADAGNPPWHSYCRCTWRITQVSNVL